jgi:hypothetical protein
MTADPQYWKVPVLARFLGVDQDKILGWIHSGELLAIDVSERRGGRPRWRIPAEAWQAFCVARSNQATLPPPRAARRRRRETSDIIQFY